MKKALLLLPASALLIIGLYQPGSTKDTGQAGNTGSPGENTCGQCHGSGTDNLSGGNISLSATDMTNWEYVPGQVYNFNLTISRPGAAIFGLGVEALNTSNSNGGVLGVSNTAETQTRSAGNGRTNIIHKRDGGLAADSKTFAFKWTAPVTASGNITLYYTGMAGNNNGNNDAGDFTFKGNQVITPAVGTSVPFLKNNSEALKAFAFANDEDIMIRFEESLNELIAVQVFSVDGKLLYETQTIPVAGEPLRISGAELKSCSGMLIIQLKQGERISRLKTIR